MNSQIENIQKNILSKLHDYILNNFSADFRRHIEENTCYELLKPVFFQNCRYILQKLNAKT